MKMLRAYAICLVLAVAGLTACGDGNGAGTTLPTSAPGVPGVQCSAVFGRGERTIVFDAHARDGMYRAWFDAARQVFAEHGYRAGAYPVQLQLCDTTQASVRSVDDCRASARSYVATASVIAVIGPVDSGCATSEIPITNRAGLAMLSPENTYVGLTRGGVGASPDEPDMYYPTGKRTYARLVGDNGAQGAADALYLQQKRLNRVYLLQDGTPYGRGIAASFTRAARKLGLTIVGTGSWTDDTSRFPAVMKRVAAARPDVMFLAGRGRADLIKAKIRYVGPNSGVKLVAPDGFASASLFQGTGSTGSDGNGTVISVAGLPPEQLPAPGQRFITEFMGANSLKYVDPHVPYVAAAAQIILESIARSDGTRADVVDQLFKTHIQTTVGEVAFDLNGDPRQAPTTMFRVVDGVLQSMNVVTPPSWLVN
jgi:branched-chain amino acid transport system substrate-binding protein